MSARLLFERSRPGKRAFLPRRTDLPPSSLGDEFTRSSPPGLPEVTEADIVREYTELGRRNFSVDLGFYPLGSCTMKFNPRVCDPVSRAADDLHPLSLEPSETGELLSVLHELERILSFLAGMERFSLSPAAGAQGELAGVLMIRKWFRDRGDSTRRKILIPDSAHGTNPASAALAGFEVETVASGPDGQLDINDLSRKVGPDTAGMMLTNPNTLGLFEERIEEISRIVHGVGGLLYYDGANLNALVGLARPGDMGFDICHLNLHKTFATPHGGGGPGAGPVGASGKLEPYLPLPIITRRDPIDHPVLLSDPAERPLSIGRLSAFHGNIGVLLRAWAYIRESGLQGLREAALTAVVNANYIRVRLEDLYPSGYSMRPSAHECVLSAERLRREKGASALDIAKGLIDEGFHPPTIYFPLPNLVPEALLIEPTETEAREDLDAFIDAMGRISEMDGESLHDAPRTTPISRPNEALAARHPVLSWKDMKDD